MIGESPTLEQAKPAWESLASPIALSAGEVHVVRASLDVSETRREQLARTLPREELERASRFHSPLDEFRFIVRRALLRELLVECLHIPADPIVFSHGDYGKPAIAGFDEKLVQFNASHSGGVALFAVTRVDAVGVDVELFRDIPDLADLASTVLSPGERTEWEAASEGDRLRAFFRYWTLKEAYLKGIGAGLQRWPDEVEVLVPNGREESYQLRDGGQNVEGWTLQSFADSDCMIGLAISNSQALSRFWKWNSEQPFPGR